VGRLTNFDLDEQVARIETGVVRDDEVSPFYDPMIAKIITKGDNRTEAIARLIFTCDSVLTSPVKNNAGFLSSLLRHSDFRAGAMDTGFIAKHGEALLVGSAASEALLDTAAISVFLMGGGSRGAFDPLDDEASGNPWRDLLGWRANASADTAIRMLCDGEPAVGKTDGKRLGTSALNWHVDDGVILVERGWPHLFQPMRIDGASHGSVATGVILAPMPGRIIAVEVAQGQAVAKGQRLLTLEAMKMEHALTAPFAGVVAELNATPGAQVQVEALLARIEPEAENA
jgi:3-methylcrotonyl-CoA carboxylase alpha subunit